MTDTNDNILDLDEAATFLRLKPNPLKRMVRTKKIPGRHVGQGVWLFYKPDLVAWIRAGYPEPGRIVEAEKPREETPCRSTHDPNPRTFGCTTALMDSEYEKALG